MIYILGLAALILFATTIWLCIKVSKDNRYTYREVDDE